MQGVGLKENGVANVLRPPPKYANVGDLSLSKKCRVTLWT